MVVERERIIERPVERETVVTNDGNSGAALLGGIVVAALLALLFFWIFSGGPRHVAPVTVEVPTTTQQTK